MVTGTITCNNIPRSDPEISTVLAMPDLNREAERFYREKVARLGFGPRYAAGDLAIDKYPEALANYLRRRYFQSGMGLYLHGVSGTGKTSALALIAYHLIKSFGIAGVAGKPEMTDCWSSPSRGNVRYLRSPELVEENEAYTNINNLKEFATIQYLLIDDIDCLESTNHAIYRLRNIIERRYNNCLTTIAAGSSSPAELAHKSGYEAIARRLENIGQVVELGRSGSEVSETNNRTCSPIKKDESQLALVPKSLPD